MKKLTKIVALFIAVITMIPAAATAQNTNMPASLPFLSSRAALRAYAKESARQVYLTLESEGMEGTWSTGTQWDGPASAETILKYVDSFRFTFNMRNPKDYVQGVAEIKNGDWDNLFSAESWGLPAAAGEEFVLPELYFWFQLESSFRSKWIAPSNMVSLCT